MPDHETVPDTRRSTWATRIVIAAATVLLLLVLYVLSIGPAILVFEAAGSHRGWVRDGIQAVYRPLEWWHEAELPGAELLNDYVRWWERLVR